VDLFVWSYYHGWFVTIRPPGHHAMYNEPNGYCVFNNAAIAIRHALDVCGLERILLVDWDAHHGQGLQYAFYDDPRYVRWTSDVPITACLLTICLGEEVLCF